MGMRLTISTSSDYVAKDLAQKLVIFPELPWILVNRVALEFRALGREFAFSHSGPASLGVAEPWKGFRKGPPKSRDAGDAERRSFIYSVKRTSKNATAKLSSPLSNIWEATPNKRVVKRVIPILSTFAKRFEASNISEQVINQALENIASKGQP